MSAGAPALQRVRRLPAGVQALGVYLGARLVSTLLVTRVARFQEASGWTPAHPSYLDFAGIWDGDWYRRVAESGYPDPMPVDADGGPGQNEWAFYPAFPFLVRAITRLTSLEWRVAAPTTALVLGAVAALAVHRLFADRAGHRVALGGVLVLAVFPSSPVLQFAYSESLALLALAGALLLLSRRHYLATFLPVAVLGLSRPVALPFAVVVGVHLILRWRARRRDALPWTQLVPLLALGLFSTVAGVAWPLLVGLINGDMRVYGDVQAAWRGAGSIVLFRPWLDMSRYLLGDGLGPVLLAVLVAGYAVLLASRWTQTLGPELTAWSAAYPVYLLAVVEPFTSVFRFLLLLFPLALPAAAAVRSRAHLVTWVSASLALQIVWLVWLWRFIPPSDYPP